MRFVYFLCFLLILEIQAKNLNLWSRNKRHHKRFRNLKSDRKRSLLLEADDKKSDLSTIINEGITKLAKDLMKMARSEQKHDMFTKRRKTDVDVLEPVLDETEPKVFVHIPEAMIGKGLTVSRLEENDVARVVIDIPLDKINKKEHDGRKKHIKLSEDLHDDGAGDYGDDDDGGDDGDGDYDGGDYDSYDEDDYDGPETSPLSSSPKKQRTRVCLLNALEEYCVGEDTKEIKLRKK